jgi:hypothetical protein
VVDMILNPLTTLDLAHATHRAHVRAASRRRVAADAIRRSRRPPVGPARLRVRHP